jgi:hypothetical protein
LVSIHQFLELLDIAKEFENSLELTSPEWYVKIVDLQI